MSREAETASRLLAKHGESVTITFPGTVGRDPVTGAPIAGTPGASHTAKGYPGQYSAAEVDDSVIKSNDVRLILELIPTRPEAGCTALIDGVSYRVMAVRPVRKAGEDVIYICQVRRN